MTTWLFKRQEEAVEEQPEESCSFDPEVFDLSLHIGSVFIVLAVSLIGAMIPRVFSNTPEV